MLLSARRFGLLCSSLLGSVIAAALPLVPAGAAPLTNVTLATDIGPSDLDRVVTVTLQLKRTHDDAFRQVLAALYDPASPRYQRWLSHAELQRYAPAQAQVDAVRDAVARAGLAIVWQDPDGFSLRVQGTLRKLGAAFHTGFRDVRRPNQEIVRVTSAAPRLDADADAAIDVVTGLDSHPARAPRTVSTSPGYAFRVPLKEVERLGGWGALYTDQVISKQPKTLKFPGTPTHATLTGVGLDPSPTLQPDFTPQQVRSIYGLGAATSYSLTGAGQTIAQIVLYGSPTALADVNAFSRLSGLPVMPQDGLTTVFPGGVPAQTLPSYTAFRAEWLHAIAPGAKIVQVALYSLDEEDILNAMQYVVGEETGTIATEDFPVDFDLIAGAAEQQAFENVLMLAAAKGITFLIATGDDGDEGPFMELGGTFNPVNSPLGAPSLPSVAPHATAVGGTSIVNRIGQPGFVSLGYGEDFSYVYGPPVYPAGEYVDFVFGTSGGESTYWPKPSWQAALPGTGRMTPDIAALAEPITGVPVVYTDPAEDNQQVVEPQYGLTTLSDAIVAGFWALANQRAGHPLGQAAPTIARMTRGITDVLPYTGKDSLTGQVTTNGVTVTETSADLFGNLVKPGTPFLASYMLNTNFIAGFAYSFDLDNSLTVTPGWDNVTGWGTPDGLRFVDAAAALGRANP